MYCFTPQKIIVQVYRKLCRQEPSHAKFMLISKIMYSAGSAFAGGEEERGKRGRRERGKYRGRGLNGGERDEIRGEGRGQREMWERKPRGDIRQRGSKGHRKRRGGNKGGGKETEGGEK